jgi:AsmA-like C-terminal region
MQSSLLEKRALVLIRRRLPYRKLAWTAGLALCLPALVLLLLPSAVNLRPVHSRLEAWASKTFHSAVDFEKLEPVLFPRPHAVVTRGRAVRGAGFSLRFDRLALYPDIWPLLKGRLAIARIKVVKPEILVHRPLEALTGQSQASRPPTDLLLKRLQEAMARIAGLPGLAECSVEQARLAWSNRGPTGTQSLRVTGLNLALKLQTPQQESFQSRFEMSIPEVVIQNDRDPVTLKALFLKGSVRWAPPELQVDFSQVVSGMPQMQLAGSAHWSAAAQPPAAPFQLTLSGSGWDLDQIRTAALHLAGDSPAVRKLFHIVQGGRIPSISAAFSLPGGGGGPAADELQINCRLIDGRISVPPGLFLPEQVSGDIRISRGRLRADHIAARMGHTRALNGTLQLGLWDGSQVFSLDLGLDADLAELPAALRKLVRDPTTTGLLDSLPAVSGRATGRLMLGNRLDRITAKIVTTARIKALDAALDLSASITDLAAPAFAGTVTARGDLGPRAVQWLGQAGSVPAAWLPRNAVSVVKARLERRPSGGLTLTGDFSPADQVAMHIALSIENNAIHLEKLHIQDAPTDALISGDHRQGAAAWDVAFSGSLYKSTVNKILPRNDILLGWLKGDAQAHIDSQAPERSTLQGRLQGREVDLPLRTTAGPVRILEASLAGHGNSLALSSARFTWAEKTAVVSGSVKLRPRILDLDLNLATGTLDFDQMMPTVQALKAKAKQASAGLKIRGSVGLRVDQAVFGGYRFSPLEARIALQKNQTIVNVAHAGLCGIETPGKIQITPDGLTLQFQPRAVHAALRDTEICLGGSSITERLEGTVDVHGQIASSGRTRQELTRNLTGRVDVQISDGRVYNVGAAGFFTNLLSFISLNQLIQGSLPDLRKNDFHYQSLGSKLALKDGLLQIEEGVLKSNSVNMVGNGVYKLSSKKLDLQLLVSPLTTVDWIVAHIPLVGHILQGTLVAIPVGVQGPIDNPTVIPLAPAAVGSRLGGILERTIKTPFRILSPLFKNNAATDP